MYVFSDFTTEGSINDPMLELDKRAGGGGSGGGGGGGDLSGVDVKLKNIKQN